MNIWSAEIKEINQIYQSVKGRLPQLEKELSKLVTTDDENMLLVYSRRCLEVIITDLCELELKRHRGTEPLQRIIDKLNKEEIVPHNIIVSMQNVNSMSTFGAHPKEFETEQVKPVLHNLKTILKWYLDFRQNQDSGIADSGVSQRKKQSSSIKSKSKSTRKIGLISGLLLIASVIIVVAIELFNFKGGGFSSKSGLIGSIVVLPFSNYTGQDSLDYFVDGMHSSLITDMGKVGSLRIPGATTSRVFKNSHKTIKEIASELKVDAALETAIMCLGEDSICVQARLIKPGQEEIQLWTADYKIAKDQILNWYNGVTKQIAEEVNVKLTPNEERLLSKSRTIDSEVYDSYLKAKSLDVSIGDLSRDTMLKAREYLEDAIQKDPDWAPPYAALAVVWETMASMGIESYEVATPIIEKNLAKALELDPDLAGIHYEFALRSWLGEWNWEKAETEFLKVIAINPNGAEPRIHYSHLLYALQRPIEARMQADLGYKQDPLNPLVQSIYAASLICDRDLNTALSILEDLLASDPNNYLANYGLYTAAFQLGNLNFAFKAGMILIKSDHIINEVDVERIENLFNEQGFNAATAEIARLYEKIAKNQYVQSLTIVDAYYQIKQDEKAMEWLEKGYEMHDNLAYITTGLSNYTRLYNNPRFIALCEKMNLPLPKTD